MRRSYAVTWACGEASSSGRLELGADGFELRGREPRSVAFRDVLAATIARGKGERLHGLPVLVLSLAGTGPLRIASLEGAGVLHELADRITL